MTGLGAAAATTVGVAVLAGTGWPGGLALATFFAGSTIISALSPDPTTRFLDAKGGRRDGWQVYANGGAAALGSLLGVGVPGLGLWIVTASLAASAADTWATAFGGRSARQPRNILTGMPVPPGTSGGVTALGAVGALLGAAAVGLAGAFGGQDIRLLPLGILIGFAGMLVDSLLGAGLQGRFFCAACGQATEQRIHRCGNRSEDRGGLPWLTNDLVNAGSTTLSAAAGWAIWALASAP